MLHDNLARTPPLLPADQQPKVYSYARWSTPEQAKGDSSRRQTEAAERWAAKRGYQLDQNLKITDEGVSAYRGGNALDGGLSRFLEACRRGLIEEGSFLLVESLDRISRMTPRKAQGIINDIVDSGVTIVTLNDDQHYSAERLDNDHMALLIALMVSWRAHEESKTKGRRVADAWREKRRQVRANPSIRLTSRGPSWLRATAEGGWEEDPVKAAIVRRIFALTLAGAGERRIAGIFNAEGVPILCHGRQWHRTTVAKVLRNDAVIGALRPGHVEYVDGRKIYVKEAPIAGAFPAVVSEEDWFAVRTLKDGTSMQPRGRHACNAAAHIFAGLAKCPACGGAMTRVSKGAKAKAGSPKLVCSAAKGKASCRYVAVRLPAVEDAFFSDWGALFESIPAAAGNDALEGLYAEQEAAIWGTEDHLRDLMEALEKAPSTAGARAVAKLEAELRSMRSALDELEERRCMADRGLIRDRAGKLFDLLRPEGTPAGEQPELDRTAINAALKLLFAAVVVDYETGTLRFRWRQGGEASIRYAWPK
jgi:DNA invertase Pin-like site-specific DNA recombinase